jgi:hypothetical protein
VVIVKINGGLGNQMFEYMFYKRIQTKFSDAKIDNSIYIRMKQHNGYELDKVFGLTPPIATETEIRRFKADDWKLHRKIQYKVVGFPDSMVNESKVLICNSDLKDNAYYTGYWINRRYFMTDENSIRNIFGFKNKMSERNDEIVKAIQNSTSVSIHIRRGDYVGNKSCGGICNKDYYDRAIKIIENRVYNPHYYLFSDDPEWVRDNFKLEQMTIVDWNKEGESYWDMYLMSRCKHNIIPNSTFSWWGAFLNPNNEKIVVGPRYWTRKQLENSSEETADAIMLENWYRIG